MDTENSLASSGLVCAGMYRRLRAGLVDWLYCCIFYLAAILAVLWGEWAYPLAMFIAVIVAWLYFALFESSASGATPGKKRYHMRVCDVNGNRITFTRASLRFVGKLLIWLLMPLPLIAAYFDRRKRAIDDFIAGTLVVDAAKTAEESSKPKPKRKSGSLLIGIPLFIAVAYVAYELLAASSKFPQERVPFNFPVALTSSANDGPKLDWVQWSSMNAVLADRPELSPQLPLGHQYVDLTGQPSGDGDTDMLSVDVSSTPGGILVKLNRRGGSYAIEATYSVIDKKVIPHTMRMWHAMTLMLAIVIGLVVAAVLEKLIFFYLARKSAKVPSL